MQRCAQEHLTDCWLMTGAGRMAGSLLGTHRCQDGTPQPSGVTKELPGWWVRGLSHPLVAPLAVGSAFWKQSRTEPVASPPRACVG